MKTLKELSLILQNIEYKGWTFEVGQLGNGYFLQARAKSSNPVVSYVFSGKKWYISPRMTQSEVLQTAFAALLVAKEQQTSEGFKYNGSQLFQSNPNALVEMAYNQQIDIVEPRTRMMSQHDLEF